MQPGDDDTRRQQPSTRRPTGASRPDYGQTTGEPDGAGDLDGDRGSSATDRGHKAKDAGRKAAEMSQKAAKGTFRMARRASTSSGAGETGLYRLIELHAFNAAGDTALAVSLAGTLFFAVPSDEARGQIALFLLITMLPFALMAPLIGPFLDRFRRGRRWAIGGTMALRALGCWSLAGAVEKDSNWMFIAALICLIASKAYGVTRASAVPRVIPEGLTLVKANSRISVAGIAGATISAPIAAGLAQIGAPWSLRYATLVFIGGTILAILLPARVDSSEGEESVDMRAMTDAGQGSRKVGITPVLVIALRCNAGLRLLSGFMTIFMAFLLDAHPLPGWEDKKTLLLGLVIGSAGVGSTVGTAIGSTLKTKRPEVTVLVCLVADVIAAIYAALFFSLIPAMILGLVAGTSQSLGKLSLDALIQREVPERVRTSVFARSETLLQLSWVIGGFIGVFIPLVAKLGLFTIAALLVGWLVFVGRGIAVSRRTHPPGQQPSGPASPPGDHAT